jgi:hypothetical protein
MTLLANARWCAAQTATVTGQVADPQGAMVMGAKLTLDGREQIRYSSGRMIQASCTFPMAI